MSVVVQFQPTRTRRHGPPETTDFMSVEFQYLPTAVLCSFETVSREFRLKLMLHRHEVGGLPGRRRDALVG